MQGWKGRLTFYLKGFKDVTIQITTHAKLGITYPEEIDYDTTLERLKPLLVKADGTPAEIIDVSKEPTREAIKAPKGRLAKKYALKREVKEAAKKPLGEAIVGPEAKYVPPASEFPRRIWELATWISHSPEGWAEDDADVKEAKSLLEIYKDPMHVPKVRTPPLDPDSYIYDWPDFVKKNLRIGSPLPRFFNLKTIYEAKWTGAKAEPDPAESPSFLGVKEFRDKDYVKWQIGVAVRRRPDDKLRVIRVELDPLCSEEWVSALCRELDADCLRITPSTDEAVARRTVFHLNKVLEQRRLLIPGRYSLLLKDLRLFNFRYTPPPEPRNHEEYLMLRDYLETAGNYVYALAASVWRADGMRKTKHFF